MADDAVLTGAAPQFTHDDIARLVSESYGVTGEVRRTLNSERDQVVLLAGEERELVVKLSNESESADEHRPRGGGGVLGGRR